jgi:hypothetical protein
MGVSRRESVMVSSTAARERASQVVELVTGEGGETAGHGASDEGALVEGVRALALVRVPVTDHTMRCWWGWVVVVVGFPTEEVRMVGD